MLLFRFTLVFFLCLLVGTQGQPVLRSVVRGATGIVRGVGKAVEHVGHAVNEVVGGVAEGVGELAGYNEKDDTASSLANAAQSLEQIAKQGSSGPQITIQQVQQADAQ